MGKQILAINAIKQMHLSHISHVQFLLLYLQLLATPSNQSVSMSIDFIAVTLVSKNCMILMKNMQLTRNIRNYLRIPGSEGKSYYTCVIFFLSM